ncbi:MAG: GNAT family N-acetyltransferase [Pseudohongiellaceae bacterium]
MVEERGNTDDFIIREAEPRDLPVLVGFLAKLALHVSGGAPQKLRKKERDKLRDLLSSAMAADDKLVVVAESPDAGLVGMGYIYIWRSQGIWEQAGDHEFRSGIIDDIWVEPEFRKLGIFSAMLRELVTFAEDHGAGELILEYSVSNKEAEATWSRLGFTTTGVRAAAFTGTVKEELSRNR